MSEAIIRTPNGVQVMEKVDPTPAGDTKTMMARLELLRERFDSVASERMPTGSFMMLAATRFIAEPKLCQCRFDTVVKCLLQVHAWGLDPTGARNGAFLLPRSVKQPDNTYAMECNIQLGYGALIDLVTREGRVTQIDAQIVYPDDEFDVSLGTDPRITHKPNLTSPKRKRNGGIAYYAVAFMDGAPPKIRVLTREQVETIRDKFAKQGGRLSPAWEGSFDEQAVKTVVHNLCKQLPVNARAAEALQYVEDAEFTMEQQSNRVVDAQAAIDALPVAADATPETSDDGAAFLASLEDH